GLVPSLSGDLLRPLGELLWCIGHFSKTHVAPWRCPHEERRRLLVCLAGNKRHAVLFEESEDPGIEPGWMPNLERRPHAGETIKESGEALVVPGQVGRDLDEKGAELRSQQARHRDQVVGLLFDALEPLVV